MTWTVLAHDAACGRCGALIPADAPVALFTTVRLIRCVDCAGVPVDEDTVDLERWRLARERTAVRVAREETAARHPTYRQRVPARRTPLASARVVTRALARAGVRDGRAAAAGDPD